MKPISLTLQAFGSYGKRQTIDFTKPEQDIFLVTGDTGAGKTTIFDAIVYAIYGEASSSNNKKAGAELQGQYVDYDVEPFVELVFSEVVGGRKEVFTVRRAPAHFRKKQRGTGVTSVAGMVSLTFEDGHEHAAKETNAKLQEIVGLTKDQFMQIAMIAQGEFMELLRADSKTKTEIFRKLFHTEIFRDMITELDSRKKEKQKEIAIIKTESMQELGHVTVPDDYPQKAVLEAQLKQVIGNPNSTMTALEELLNMIRNMCNSLKIDKKNKEQDYKQKAIARDSRRDALNSANALLQQYQLLESAQKIFAECDANKEQMNQKMLLARQLRCAYELAATFELATSLNKTVRELKDNMITLEKQLPTLADNLKKANAKAEETQLVYDTQKKQFAAVEERVNKALESFRKIAEVNQAKQQAQKTLENALAKHEQAKLKVEQFAEEENTWNKQMKQYEGVGEQLARCSGKLEEGRNLGKDFNEIYKLRNALAKQKLELGKAQEAYSNAKDQYDKKQKEFIQKQNLFYDAQAGILAREKLVVGKACPVCGAIDHPQPCTLSDEHSEITREALEALRTTVEMLNQDYVNKSNASNQIATQCNEKQANIEESTAKVQVRLEGLLSNTEFVTDVALEAASLEGMTNTLRSWLAKMETMENVLEDKQEKQAALKAKLDGATATREALAKQSDKAKEEAHNAQTNVVTIEQSLTVLQEGITYASKDIAAKELQDAQAKLEQAKSDYEPARSAADLAKETFDRNNAVYTNYQNTLPAKETEAATKQSEYMALLKQHNISEDVWQQLVKTYAKEQGNQFEADYNNYVNQRTIAETQIKAAEEFIGDKEKPDIEMLMAANTEAEQVLAKADEALKMVSEAYRINDAVVREIEPKMDARKTQIAEYSRIENLYKRLSGNMTGSRMDIETYVQRYHLERVLYAANQRFYDMTDGQYELRMYDIEKASEGKNKGLDLMVYSTVTGKEREVRTLSGGESFMAALALALGMADRVQEKSAAIHLDIMFIDEGFGSLDDHSRSQAIKVLQQMADGSKMIGIISHVTELKQVIEDQLVVTKDETGSHARWER